MIKQDIYIATLKEKDDIGKIQQFIYNDPIKYSVTISPYNGDTAIEAYGERISSIYKIMLSANLAKNFNEGDLVYLWVTPDNHEADYKISSIQRSAVKTVLYLERRV